MEYYEHIVKNRHSCRNFAPTKVEDDKLVAIREYYEEEESELVEGIGTSLQFFFGNVYETLSKSVGYNGYCIKAPTYMLLFSEEKDHYLENAGYIAQGITLKMTELGLAACWLTINDAAGVTAALNTDNDDDDSEEGMVLACVIAFGYRDSSDDAKIAPKKSLDDMTDGYKYGKDIDTSRFYGEVEDGLRAIAHAQSFANKQPYKVIVDDDIISLVGIEDPDTNYNDTHLNYGIAMFNYYAVTYAVRADAPKWSFKSPERDLGLPAGVKYIAKCAL